LNEATFVSAGRGLVPPEPGPARPCSARVRACGECGPWPSTHNNKQ